MQTNYSNTKITNTNDVKLWRRRLLEKLWSPNLSSLHYNLFTTHYYMSGLKGFLSGLCIESHVYRHWLCHLLIFHWVENLRTRYFIKNITRVIVYQTPLLQQTLILHTSAYRLLDKTHTIKINCTVIQGLSSNLSSVVMKHLSERNWRLGGRSDYDLEDEKLSCQV